MLPNSEDLENMSKYLIDTNIFIDLLRDNLDLKTFISSGDLAISTISLSELYYGAERTDRPNQSHGLIESLLEDLNLKILPFSDKSSKIFAKLKVNLEKKGQKIEDFDLMIASTAIENDKILVTGNLKHFERIEGLKLWRK